MQRTNKEERGERDKEIERERRCVRCLAVNKLKRKRKEETDRQREKSTEGPEETDRQREKSTEGPEAGLGSPPAVDCRASFGTASR